MYGSSPDVTVWDIHRLQVWAQNPEGLTVYLEVSELLLCVFYNYIYS